MSLKILLKNPQPHPTETEQTMNEIQPAAPISLDYNDLQHDLSILAGAMNAATIKRNKAHFKQYTEFCGSMRSAIRPQMLNMWRQHLLETTYTRKGEQKQYSPETINVKLAAVRAVMKAAGQMGIIDETDAAAFKGTAGVKPSALRQNSAKYSKSALTPQTVRAMIDSIPKPEGKGDHPRSGYRPEHAMHKALLLLLFSSGLRVTNAANLKYSQIERVSSAYIVNVKEKGKAEEKPRAISTETKQAIDEWLLIRDERYPDQTGNDYIFTGNTFTQDGNLKPICKQRVSQIIKKYGELAGAPDVTPHDARRFVLTQLISTEGIETAQQQAGHAKMDTTIRYDMEVRTLGKTENLF